MRLYVNGRIIAAVCDNSSLTLEFAEYLAVPSNQCEEADLPYFVLNEK